MGRTKIEYLDCKCSDITHEEDVEVRIDTKVIARREKFKYLGSLSQGYSEVDKDVIHRIEVRWRK